MQVLYYKSILNIIIKSSKGQSCKSHGTDFQFCGVSISKFTITQYIHNLSKILVVEIDRSLDSYEIVHSHRYCVD
jgi:hypothetical protein